MKIYGDNGNKIELVDSEARQNMHTHDNKSVLDGITDEKIQAWDDNIARPTKTSELENDSNFIALSDIPIASENGAYGLVKVGYANYGLYIGSDGSLRANPTTTALLSTRLNGSNNAVYRPIPPNLLDTAVRLALTDGQGPAYTDEEKAAARSRLGIDAYIQSVLQEVENGYY